eukprot:scaffold422449_cov83-Attheya_sp.AAC.2
MDIGSFSLANKYCRPTRNDRAAKNATKKKKIERGTRAATDGGIASTHNIQTHSAYEHPPPH